MGWSASFRPRLSLSVPLAEQPRQRSAKPRRRVRLPHGTPVSKHEGRMKNAEGSQPSGTAVRFFILHQHSAFPSERSLKVRHLLREQEQAGAYAEMVIMRRYGCAA